MLFKEEELDFAFLRVYGDVHIGITASVAAKEPVQIGIRFHVDTAGALRIKECGIVVHPRMVRTDVKIGDPAKTVPLKEKFDDQILSAL